MVSRGWALVEYDWDPNTGLATLLYERIRVDTEEVQEKVETRKQTLWFTPGLKMKI